MLAAGLLAKKAVERGLSVSPAVKASLAPGSRVVTDYLAQTGLQPYLDQLGFNLVGYGCTTCIGNSGPLDSGIEEAVTKNDLIAAAVLSGNRNFEARVHQSIKANFLMCPPLVVAFALAGRVDIDLTPRADRQRAGTASPSSCATSGRRCRRCARPAARRSTPRPTAGSTPISPTQNPLWNEIPSRPATSTSGIPQSTYIQEPPVLRGLRAAARRGRRDPRRARAGDLRRLGDDRSHLPGRGASRRPRPPASTCSRARRAPEDFNSYGSRRGNDRVMTRGTFANVRIKNLHGARRSRAA